MWVRPSCACRRTLHLAKARITTKRRPILLWTYSITPLFYLGLFFFSGTAGQVRVLAAASTESAARVGPAIVRLQMLTALREAWALRWPGLALGPAAPDRAGGSAGAGCQKASVCF